ncbi:MAG TPA: DUF3576 domain-containing protein [Alphaproteobacteria bacterium]|nr:DUF3576 domain-containing protein [Alphaproteobacteria bacterium]
MLRASAICGPGAAALLAALVLLTGCADTGIGGAAYPDRERERLYRYGRLGGENGLFGFDVADGAMSGTSGWRPNHALWIAALDTVAFMPITSADPASGVILTDWYAQPGNSAERFKVDIHVRGSAASADNLRVSVFRQIRAEGEWRDAPVSDGVADRLQRTVLARAGLPAGEPR